MPEPAIRPSEAGPLLVVEACSFAPGLVRLRTLLFGDTNPLEHGLEVIFIHSLLLVVTALAEVGFLRIGGGQAS